MTVTLKLTRLPLLNNSIVIKQSGGHFFIAAENSFIIDKAGLLQLLVELGKIDFIEPYDLENISDEINRYYGKEIEDAKNKEDSSNTDIG